MNQPREKKISRSCSSRPWPRRYTKPPANRHHPAAPLAPPSIKHLRHTNRPPKIITTIAQRRPSPTFAIRPNPPHRCPKNNPRLNRSFIINPIDQYPFTEPNHPSHHPKLQITIHHSTTISGAAVKPRSRLGPWRSKESVAQRVRSRGEVGGCGEGCSVVKRTKEPRRCPTMAESMAKNWVEK
ncbi:hypothetical protein Droror1_Dr00024697 [Drosera rotundifolia]